MPVEYDARRPRLPLELARRIDAVRGQVPFNRWVVEHLKGALIVAEGPPGRTARDVLGDRADELMAPLEKALSAKPGTTGVPAASAAPPRASEPQKPKPQFSHGHVCPERGCNWSAPSPNATCPKHNRKIREP